MFLYFFPARSSISRDNTSSVRLKFPLADCLLCRVMVQYHREHNNVFLCVCFASACQHTIESRRLLCAYQSSALHTASFSFLCTLASLFSVAEFVLQPGIHSMVEWVKRATAPDWFSVRVLFRHFQERKRKCE